MYKITENKGTWIADREYDNKRIFDHLLDSNRLFVIRVRINPRVSRDIRDEKGNKRRLSTLAWNTKLKYKLSDYSQRGKIVFGFTKLTLPHREESLSLVVYLGLRRKRKQKEKEKEPVAVLTNRVVETPGEAAQVVEEYLGRWGGCEDPIRFLKQVFRLEKFLIDGIGAIRAWFFFIGVAFSILFELECWEKILKCIVELSQPFGKEVKFRYYRIVRGLKEFFYLFIPSYPSLARPP